MKIVMLSDAHITSGQPAARKDEALYACTHKMLHLLHTCRAEEAAFLQAGDLFQGDRDWGALTPMVEILMGHNTKILTVLGQHDKYYRSKNKATNLGVLEAAGLVHILGPEPYEMGPAYFDNKKHKRLVKVYGAGWGDPIPAPEETTHHVYNILVLHAPVSTKELYPDHQYQDAKDVLKTNQRYDLILCGDTHRFFKIPIKGKYHTQWILNTGPMFRREATEYNLQHKPGYFLWHNGAVKWYEIPHERPDVALSRAHLTHNTIRHTSLEEFTAKIRNRGRVATANLRERVITKIAKARPRPPVAKLLKEVMDGQGQTKAP